MRNDESVAEVPNAPIFSEAGSLNHNTFLRDLLTNANVSAREDDGAPESPPATRPCAIVDGAMSRPLGKSPSAVPEAPPLLGADDAPPVVPVNGPGRARVVLLCDHASAAIPKALGRLGLDPADLERHIAWDIGAAELVRRLAGMLDAPAFLAGYSRLVIDCNRPLDELTSIREISDGTVIPGNRNLPPLAAAARAESIFRPYHAAIAARLAAFGAQGVVPAVVSVHSFTPMMRGARRPWHVGVLSGRDRRMADLVIAALSRIGGFRVGDNRPYSGLDAYGYSIETHARPLGRPNVLLEIRQDLIDTRPGVETMAEALSPALAAALADSTLYRRWEDS